MESVKYWLWLTVKVGLNHKKIKALLDTFQTVEGIFRAKPNQFLPLKFLSDSEMNLLSNKDLSGLDAFLDVLHKNSVKIVTIDMDEYPGMLKYITDPPYLLYCRGRFINLNSHLCIAMVGSRTPTGYGTTVARELAYNVAKNGIMIVSGMADGIDSCAHLGALDAGMPTVAVLGCGVNRVYPASNASLMRRIMETGMVISEYPPNTEPLKHHFPQRNRIISGLSVGTVVVEANISSGSLITARLAYENNRDVFAVPGNINNLRAKGTNQLLKDGAIFVTCAEDIVEPYRQKYSAFLNTSFDNPKEQEKDRESADTLNEMERKILAVLDGEPLHVDRICDKLGIGAAVLSGPLLQLEIKGKIVCYPGNCYGISV